MEKRKAKDKERDKAHRIINLNDYRKNKNEQRRRQYERVLFNRILGVYSFAEKIGLHHVEVIDVSFSGIKFREGNPENPFKLGQKVALRFYFTPSSYLRMIMEIKRLTMFKTDEREGIEYGCELDKKTRSYEAIQKLIAFMYKYSEIACQDENPPMIWF